MFKICLRFGCVNARLVYYEYTLVTLVFSGYSIENDDSPFQIRDFLALENRKICAKNVQQKLRNT